jgi:hypothetical protein
MRRAFLQSIGLLQHFLSGRVHQLSRPDVVINTSCLRLPASTTQWTISGDRAWPGMEPVYLFGTNGLFSTINFYEWCDSH